METQHHHKEPFELQFELQKALEDFYSRDDLFNEYWSVKQTAEYLGVSVETIYGYVNRKVLRSYRPDKLVYFSQADIKAYIRRGLRRSQEEIDSEAATSVNNLERLYEGL